MTIFMVKVLFLEYVEDLSTALSGGKLIQHVEGHGRIIVLL
jgi:hypothetical protein